MRVPSKLRNDDRVAVALERYCGKYPDRAIGYRGGAICALSASEKWRLWLPYLTLLELSYLVLCDRPGAPFYHQLPPLKPTFLTGRGHTARFGAHASNSRGINGTEYHIGPLTVNSGPLSPFRSVLSHLFSAHPPESRGRTRALTNAIQLLWQTITHDRKPRFSYETLPVTTDRTGRRRLATSQLAQIDKGNHGTERTRSEAGRPGLFTLLSTGLTRSWSAGRRYRRPVYLWPCG